MDLKPHAASSIIQYTIIGKSHPDGPGAIASGLDRVASSHGDPTREYYGSSCLLGPSDESKDSAGKALDPQVRP